MPGASLSESLPPVHTVLKMHWAACGFIPVVCLLRQMVPLSATKPQVQVSESTVVPFPAGPRHGPPQVLQGAIPSGHIPKPVIMPDYIA